MSPISGQQSHSDQIADKNFTSEKKSGEVTLLYEIFDFAHFGKIMDMNLTSEKKNKTSCHHFFGLLILPKLQMKTLLLKINDAIQVFLASNRERQAVCFWQKIVWK